MLIQRAYKAELKPTQLQRQQFARHCGTARFAFNFALGRKIEHYRATGKALSRAKIDVEFNRRKQVDLSWTYSVSKWAHQAAIRDCETAFQNFFRGLKTGRKVGFPKFKSKHRSRLKYRVPGEVVHVEKHFIKLPKIGSVRLRRYGYVPTEEIKINSVTISERAGRWFASVQVEETIEVGETQTGLVGIDLGLTSFAVGSDGSRFQSPKPLAKSLRKLRRLSRQLSRKQKGSNNRAKAKVKLAKLHFRISNQRADFLHKTSYYYASRFGVICIENLHVRGMLQNRCLSRAIGDAGWGEFARQLGYKTSRQGGRVIEADRFYASTSICSLCDTKQTKLPLNVRTWECECGATHDRDKNASYNLENFGTAVVTAEAGWKQLKPVERPRGLREAGTTEMG